MKYTVLFFALLFVSSLIAADWTLFHGPGADNRSPDTGLLESWPESGPPLLWQIDTLGEKTSGYSSVVIRGDRLFTAGSRDGRSAVFCCDLDGRILWQYDNGPVWTKNYLGTRSTPTLDGDRVYDFSSMGRLVCLDAGTGEKIWDRDILHDYEGENIIWGLSESVRIDGDKLICSPGGKKASVVALDKRTGKEIWISPPTGEKTAYASSMFFEQDGIRFLAMMYAKGLLLIDLNTGERLATFPHTQRYDINCTKPIYHDGHLFLTNPATAPVGVGAVLLKVSVHQGKVSLDEVWRNKNFDNLHDGVILLDGYLYGSSHEHRGGLFMCVDWKTGETVYENRDAGRGAFTFAEGLIYFFGENGEFRLIRPNPKEYDVVSRWTAPEGGEGPLWAHPVIHGKRLYLRHGKFLYCYDISRK